MKAHVLHEPELEFRAGNRHIDPRYGIAVYDPADADAPSAPHAITVEHNDDIPDPENSEGTDTDDHEDGEIGNDFHDLLKAQALGLSCRCRSCGAKPGKAPRKRATVPAHSRMKPPGHGTCTPRCITRPVARLGGCRVTAPTCPPVMLGSASTAPLTTKNYTLSSAQVFNERGDGVVVRGGAAKISKT